MSVSKTPRWALKRIEKEKEEQRGKLDLSWLGLKEIPVELLGMQWLKALSLSGNQLQKMKNLEGLIILNELFLDHNQIQKIEGLEALTALKVLSLSGNQIQKIECLEAATAVNELWLDSNQIQNIEGLETLTTLEKLRLTSNQLSELKPIVLIIKQNPKIQISCSGNSLTDIEPAIIAQGNQAILDWFAEKERQGEIENDHIRLIFLGNSTSGKTSLAKFIGTGKYEVEEKTTHGIQRFTWELQKEDGNTYRVNVWDFGGQEYYHATHRIFLGNNAVYVVVCSSETETDKTIETFLYLENGETTKEMLQHYPYTYWLDSIKYYADHEQQLPPVLLVQAKCDKQGRLLHFADTERIHYKLPDATFYHISIEHARRLAAGEPLAKKEFARNYETFRETLEEVLAASASRITIPKNYPEIRNVLQDIAKIREGHVSDKLRKLLADCGIRLPENLSKMLPELSLKDYEEIAKRCSKDRSVNFDLLHMYLMDMVGSILHFPDNEQLKDKIWIDPDWLHQKIYRILSEHVLHHEGRFNLKHIFEELKCDEAEAREMAAVLLELRLTFEAAHDKYIAPQYLPDICKNQELLDRSLGKEKFRHSLSILFPGYLPPSIITEYIAQKGPYALNDIYWRYGLMYEHPVTEDCAINTYIICWPETQELQIWLPQNEEESLKQETIRDFVETVVVKIAHNQSILLRKPEHDKGASYKLLCEAKRQSIYSVTRGEEDVVKSSGYFPYLPDYGNNAVNIFISYSHKQEDRDEAHPIRQFIEDFNLFCKVEGVKINIVSDLNIAVGERWREFIATEVRRCDIFIGLISQEFLNSAFIREHELGAVLERNSKGHHVQPYLIRFDTFNRATSNSIREFEMAGEQGVTYLDIYKDARKRKQYIERLANDLTGKILEIWSAKTGR